VASRSMSIPQKAALLSAWVVVASMVMAALSVDAFSEGIAGALSWAGPAAADRAGDRAPRPGAAEGPGPASDRARPRWDHGSGDDLRLGSLEDETDDPDLADGASSDRDRRRQERTSAPLEQHSTLIGPWPARRGHRGPGPASTSGAADEARQREYASVREYLREDGEPLSSVRDASEIVDDPSNVVGQDGAATLLAWDRWEGDAGSSLYVLQQDRQNRISQVHRFFCPERRLDTLAESCVPIASLYSDRGMPVAVAYAEDGTHVESEASDLDPSLFSISGAHADANELLIALQDHFDSVRE